MGKIEVRRVIMGGLIAGAVISVIDVALYGVILKAPMAVAMQRLPPMPKEWQAIEVPWFVLVDLLAGILLVWLYAAIRPRFGARRRTAVIAGLAGWSFAGLLCNLIQLPNGFMPYNLVIITTGVMLAQYVLAVVIGARFYTERASAEVAA
jgi:hypothetical protein